MMLIVIVLVSVSFLVGRALREGQYARLVPEQHITLYTMLVCRIVFAHSRKSHQGSESGVRLTSRLRNEHVAFRRQRISVA